MSTDFQRQKTSEALSQVSVVIGMLRDMGANSWIGYFERLELALKSNDIEAAVRARQAIPYAGMGGFLEFLENFPEVQPFEKELMALVGDLKLSLRYGVERERLNKQ